ncbi:MAG: (Fe-S)-binding protein [Candidatus Aminicenantes bacterium]|nr:(Fe-S)-binding protein [Candidatus Aminicenantes bacterium]
MSEKSSNKDELLERIENLSAQDHEKILETFKHYLTSEYAAFLNTCAHCGLCADSCHYYLTDKDPKSIPAYKLKQISKVFNSTFDLVGKRFPGLVGAEKLSNKMIKEWVDTLFGRCSLCGRCTINCAMGINIPYLIRAARGALASVGIVPLGLQSTVDTAVNKGNNMGILKEDWLETVEWLEEELQQDVQNPKAKLPLDKPGSRVLYTINPREAMFFPLSITAAGKVFYAAQESWTFSSENFDVTNYGLYNGDDEAAGMLSSRLIDTMHALGCRELILAECGHGYNSNRWEAPEWISREYGEEVKSILQLIADYIREARIKLDPSKNSEIVTLHDPCNLVRLGGIVEEQRFILRHSVANFVEMTPNREKNYCCGGGGGQLAMTRFSERRIQAGGLKAEQIRATGAKVVATPCHNCIDQLMELNKHYKLDIEIKTVTEIVADALILPA